MCVSPAPVRIPTLLGAWGLDTEAVELFLGKGPFADYFACYNQVPLSHQEPGLAQDRISEAACQMLISLSPTMC